MRVRGHAPNAVGRNALTLALLLLGLGASPTGAASYTAGRFSSFPFDDAQPGAPARVCLILGSARPHTPSCAPGADVVAITGLPPRTNSDDIAIADVGDVNGGRFADFAISDSAASFDGRPHAGVTWIVFGRPRPGTIDLAHLGSGGFEIGGPTSGAQTGIVDQTDGGGDVGAVNGGRLDSIVVSEQDAPPLAGRAWVVFGRPGNATVDLADLGNRGFAIDGGEGAATIIGDVNGDGRADIALGGTGAITVVYGSASTATVRLGELGARGFRITGLDAAVGGPIVGVGDLQGNGIDDMLVGNPWSGGECGPNAPILAEICPGQAYVIYGERANENIDVHHLGAHGYVISSPSDATDGLGSSLAAASDTAGSGHNDLAVSDNAHVFVIAAHAGTQPVDLDRRSFGGFVINIPQGSGISLGPGQGPPIAWIGDFTGNGLDDILLEPPTPSGNGSSFYIVYGRHASTPVTLAHLGDNGVRIH